MSKKANLVVVAALALWSALLLVYPPHGYDYQIYTFNADLTRSGLQAFGRSDSLTGYQAAYYLDYTGAQHLTYVALRSVPFGFQLWTLATLALCLWFAISLRGVGLAAVIAFSPVVWYSLVVAAWEDKLLFLATPLLAVLLIRSRRLTHAAILIGLSCSVNGVLLFFVPVFVLHVLLECGRAGWRLIGLVGLAAMLGLVPYFPDALWGWVNRAHRMSDTSPFWWSLWRLLPAGLYVPALDRLATVAAVGLALVGWWRGRISIESALVLCLVPVTLLGVYSDQMHLIPLLIVATAVWRVNLIVLALALLVYVPLVNIGNAEITVPLLVVFYAPVVLLLISSAPMLLEALRERRPGGHQLPNDRRVLQ